ncbi:D-ala-D-ala transporter subunit [Acidihalobacter yilgarnensis]|uniref:D-ala-D-ala transporter subunit n=1 Tax=Acidihalobacter yilgarnensis TaxID=2819280 RepID=A0A1D8IK03_9GAMM|nr:D,D-dipeptide ABC transporter permease [Acidihalobacter yilgarnensis]AOU96754.1 D-ala-D-ala transporter subunit [Acidihalobacter yilgarnensis]
MSAVEPAIVNGAGARGGYLLHRLRRSPLTLLGTGMIVAILFAVLLLPFFITTNPDHIDLAARLASPSWAHWFGTDEVGRDIFTRVLYGGRISIGVGFFVVAVSAGIGTLIGALTGVIGRWVDTVVMRLMDVVMSVPSLVLTLALAAALGPSLWNAMLAIALVRIPAYVRLTRGQTLSLRESGYVQAARVFGANPWQLLRWHIAANAMPPIIVQATLDIGNAILMASALSFIGLGAQPPTAEWGAMVATGRNYILDQWWYSAFPGGAILCTAAAFNLLGDGLRDLLDPRQRGR